MKKGEFVYETLDFLLQAIIALEANLILQDAKYLDLRTKLYIEVARIYESQEALNAAITLLTSAI